MDSNNSPEQSACDHVYRFTGVVRSLGRMASTGEGDGGQMHLTVYEDKFSCTRCLDTQYTNHREVREFGLPQGTPK